tara:strand:- start:4408 stop:4929 length:522 start_codon:yes stop_codon:yes gene_type:complete
MFNAPIPGQSLTAEPKNYAWENPPQFSTPEESLIFHLERLQEPERTKSVLGLIDLGLDIKTMTEGILRGAVANGRHSIDVSMIIGPIIHEYIVGTAEAAGLEYDEGLETNNKFNREETNKGIREREARKILAQFEEEGEVDIPEESMEKVPEEEVAKEQPKEMPKGLMSRGDM